MQQGLLRQRHHTQGLLHHQHQHQLQQWRQLSNHHQPAAPSRSSSSTARSTLVPCCAVVPRNSSSSGGSMGPEQQQQQRFQSLGEFYQFYRGEHQRTGCRVLHFVGTSLFLAQAAAAVATRTPLLLLTGPVSAYTCAWIGHFFIEHNKPATFKYPVFSLISDFIMFFNILTGKESLVGSSSSCSSGKKA